MRAGRPVLPVLAVLTACTLAAVPASAYWGAGGSGSATATTGTLAAPGGVTVPDQSVLDVPVSWSPGSAGATPEGYFVTRSDGETTSPACDSAPTVLVAGPSCVDVDVPPGEYTYVVTSVFRSWSAPSAPSAAVLVQDLARFASSARSGETAGLTEQTGDPDPSPSDVSSAPTGPLATSEPIPSPLPEPSAQPTPTAGPTPGTEPEPTVDPTAKPTPEPTPEPTPIPTPSPTDTTLDRTATS